MLLSDAFVEACAVFTLQLISCISVSFAGPRSLWRKHIQILYRNITAFFLGGGGWLFEKKTLYFLFIHWHLCVFRAWSKPWQLWCQHHHHQSSPTITAGKVVEEHWGQFLVKDALVLDIVHRHSTCSASLLPHPALPHLPAALQLLDVTRQTSKFSRHRKDPDHCFCVVSSTTNR